MILINDRCNLHIIIYIISYIYTCTYKQTCMDHICRGNTLWLFKVANWNITMCLTVNHHRLFVNGKFP